MQFHPTEGRRLLQGIEMLRPAIAAIYAHHERYDGSGYPEGLTERVSREKRFLRKDGWSPWPMSSMRSRAIVLIAAPGKRKKHSHIWRVNE